MNARSGTESDRRYAAWVWRCVQWEWTEAGWSRVGEVTGGGLGRGLGGVVVSALLLVVSVVSVVVVLAPLPGVGRVILAVPVTLSVFVAVGWVLVPWLVSTDRWRAAFPVGVLVVGVGVLWCGGWWVLVGGLVVGVAAGLGAMEVRLTGRDVRIEEIRG